MQLSNQAIGQAFESFPAGGRLSLEDASNRAAALLMRDYAELIATLPENWPVVLQSWLRINGPSGDAVVRDVFNIGAWMESALLATIDAGTLTPVLVTKESMSDLAKLRRTVAYHNLIPQTEEPAAVTESVPAAPSEDQLNADAIAFWRANPTGVVKSRMRREPDFAARIEALMAENKI